MPEIYLHIIDEQSFLKIVVRLPSLIVPPLFSGQCSGISIINGSLVLESISVVFAFSKCITFLRKSIKFFYNFYSINYYIQCYLANSITATCKPRQIPKNGIRFSRHHLHASILPSTPLVPKPPGTITPLIKKNKYIEYVKFRRIINLLTTT